MRGNRFSTSSAYTPDGRTILTRSGSVSKLWNAKTAREVARLPKSNVLGRCYRFSKSGKPIYRLSRGGNHKVFNDVHLFTLPALAEIAAEIDKNSIINTQQTHEN